VNECLFIVIVIFVLQVMLVSLSFACYLPFIKFVSYINSWIIHCFYYLQEHEVDKMFPLRPGRLPENTVQNIVFITRPKLSLMELVAQNVIKLVAVSDALINTYLFCCLEYFHVIRVNLIAVDIYYGTVIFEDLM